ncbi:ATP-dependent DNA/RNA helicase DHX36 [Anthophora quadrimaculata]
MPRCYGSHFAQDMYSRHDKYGSRAESSESGGSRVENTGAQGQSSRGQRHPPWLKGKEIGLYYRNKAREKKGLGNVQIIKLPENVQSRITRALDNFTEYYDSLYNNHAYVKHTNSKLENKYMHIHDSQFKRKFLNIVSGNIQENLAKSLFINSKLERDSDLDDLLLKEYSAKQFSREYVNMVKFRLKLPAFQKQSEILELLKENQVVVISGETGCGKTTQVAQFILDDQIVQGNGSITRIICTQPRRISAISVAERVAAERVEKLGESIGFQIRLEKILPRDRGSILFCTTGMLLQFLQNDPALMQVSHIVLDEIHERSTESDFILALLKLIILKRPNMKILLMSATLNSERFSEYYHGCPMIHIPGFVYPVQEFYLEDILGIIKFEFPVDRSTQYSKYCRKHIDKHPLPDKFHDVINSYIMQLPWEISEKRRVIDELQNPRSEMLSLDLIELLIQHICRTQGPGAILVFLPGMMDIIKLNKMMMASNFYSESQYVIYPLHSRMPTIDQKAIFQEPPEGVRKIIIATSIAETSITIEDVVYVIDCGKIKFNKFDPVKNIHTLEPEWVSLANAKQRKGRAGRVKPGICYHMYTRGREMTFDKYPIPEILRTCLEEIILQIKMLQLGDSKTFLSSVIDPPNLKAIDVSLELLRNLNALDNDENLTPLGYHLAQLPLDPRTGKMIIWGALFSCVQPVFAIAASLSFKDAFYCPLGKEIAAREKKLELSQDEYSDHIALSEALRRFEIAYKKKSAVSFCKDYFLSFNTLQLLSEMKSQFAQHLCQMKFLETENPSDKNANINSRNTTLVKAIVCAVMYPNIAVVRSVTKTGTLAYTVEYENVAIHPSSVNNKIMSLPSPYITYFAKKQSTAIYLHVTTCVTVPILLFALPNTFMKKEKGKYVISLSATENFICDLRTARLIHMLREQFENVLEYKITHPGVVTWNSYEGDLLKAVIEFVCQKDEKMERKYDV